MSEIRYKKTIGPENFIFTFAFFGFFAILGYIMGPVNMLSTLMATAFDLLINTCLFIMSISVLAGALSALFAEFGLVALVDIILSKVMNPLYNLPGAASLGVLNCYLSDNPAILTLANEDTFKGYFRKYQLPSLTNLGTSFGMGLIVTTSMMSLPIQGAAKAALIGNIGAIIGSIVSVRLMQSFTKKIYGTKEMVTSQSSVKIPVGYRPVREGGIGARVLDAILSGGKSGVEMGLAVIPGVLIMCSFVLLLTNGPNIQGTYDGGLGQGVPFLPWLGDKLSFIIKPLFGFSSSQSISVPITALGAAGAAIGMAKNLVGANLASGNDIAVFTAMCMCWSGYLSTHIAMMDALGTKESTGPAIISHTLGGLVAGVAAHFIYLIF